MQAALKKVFRFMLEVERHELKKVILLSITFFLLIGAYTVTRELKDAVFSTIVGQDRKLLAYAKIFSMFVLIPAIFFHSRLVDLIKRHHLLYFYATFYTIAGFIFVIFLGHPTIGLPNTISSPNRLLGWLFYFFIEGYAPLVVSVFWAFANSITTPVAAKNNYTVMIAGSKLGGIVCASSAWFLLMSGRFSDVTNIQALLALSSVFLSLVPLVIYFLVKYVPQRDLHGYEAAYKLQKERTKRHDEEQASVFSSMLSGLVMLFKYPYVMGIFGMSFFFELISQALKVENIIFGKTTCSSLSEFTAFLLWQALLVHIVAFLVVLFGTRALISYLGERRSLLLIPAATGIAMLGFVLRPSYATAIFAFVVARSVNYAFAAPLRESLYIPTVKEVQFKSKSWIDGFGTKFAKTCASSFNMYTDGLVGSVLLSVQTTFFSIVVLFWFLVAYALGWRFEKAVKRNEVIGAEEAHAPSSGV
jgi:ATP:ADP antiporter, AAA family